MNRRRFDHFYVELCCALVFRLHRYPLWIEMCNRDCNPESLSAADLLAFIDDGLDGCLADQGQALTPRARRKLRREMERYNPSHTTPYELMERIAGTTR